MNLLTIRVFFRIANELLWRIINPLSQSGWIANPPERKLFFRITNADTPCGRIAIGFPFGRRPLVPTEQGTTEQGIFRGKGQGARGRRLPSHACRDRACPFRSTVSAANTKIATLLRKKILRPAEKGSSTLMNERREGAVKSLPKDWEGI